MGPEVSTSAGSAPVRVLPSSPIFILSVPPLSQGRRRGGYEADRRIDKAAPRSPAAESAVPLKTARRLFRSASNRPESTTAYAQRQDTYQWYEMLIHNCVTLLPKKKKKYLHNINLTLFLTNVFLFYHSICFKLIWREVLDSNGIDNICEFDIILFANLE